MYLNIFPKNQHLIFKEPLCIHFKFQKIQFPKILTTENSKILLNNTDIHVDWIIVSSVGIGIIILLF